MTTAFDTRLFLLAQQAGRHLLEKKWMVATAESCTGGGLGYWITSVPGSSQWYERGFITYSNAAKSNLLGVKNETLEKFGAVSAETVREMADGGLIHSQAHICVAITGIAGPDGGTVEKPVGTTWMAIAMKGQATHVWREVFGGNRDDVRQTIIQRTLEKLIDLA